MKKTYLLTPGPTPVPERVLARLGAPLLHHRTTEFQKLFQEIRDHLKLLFQTKNEVLVLATTGTGAMDASVCNLFSAGEEVITINAGKFGERWTQIAKAYGLHPHELSLERGKSLDLKQLENWVSQHSNAKGILFQASETATGLKLPSREIAKIAKKFGMLSICDAITACGVFELPMDEFEIDVLITGGQKALMVPPGIACIALSPKAWDFAKKSNLPKYYLDLKKELKAHLKNQTAWTPATGLLQGLHESLKMLFETGLTAVYQNNAILAAATRAGVQAMQLKLVSADSPSEAVTAVWLPDSISNEPGQAPSLGKKLIRLMADRYGVYVIGGQDELEGRIVRLSHFGYVSIFDITTALAALEMALAELGAQETNQKIGTGPAAALNKFYELQNRTNNQ